MKTFSSSFSPTLLIISLLATSSLHSEQVLVLTGGHEHKYLTVKVLSMRTFSSSFSFSLLIQFLLAPFFLHSDQVLFITGGHQLSNFNSYNIKNVCKPPHPPSDCPCWLCYWCPSLLFIPTKHFSTQVGTNTQNATIKITRMQTSPYSLFLSPLILAPCI